MTGALVSTYRGNKGFRISVKWLLVFIGFGLLTSCGGSNTTAPKETVIVEPVFFIDLINQIEAVSAQQYVSPITGYVYLKLTVEQPIDHNDPNSPTFNQRVRLLMFDENAPIILQTRGYGMPNESNLALHDLSTMIGANQIEVEHRYFGASTPQSTSPQEMDWSTLTIAQAAADHHAIITKLKPLLTGNWIATGHSKGGMTATYLKRFYPDDLAGVVAYVAPLSLSMWDERFADYSVSVVDETCRLKFETYQRQALLRIDELATMMIAWADENQVTVDSHGYDVRDRIQAEIALSWITIGSYYEDMLCEFVPLETASTDEYFEFIYHSGGFEYMVDEGLMGWLPYHMQAALELGNFAAPLSHIEDLLSFDVKDFAINMVGTPLPEFDPQVMQDIYDWAAQESSQMIMIYGEQDIFTGGAYPIVTDEARDLQLHIAPGLHSIGLGNLSQEAQQQVSGALQRWAAQ